MPLPLLSMGTTVNDRYVLRRKLGSDGNVYEAHDRILDKNVALKLLEPGEDTEPNWSEARRLEQLRSRYIVEVINADIIVNSDIKYIATELLLGGDLESSAAGLGLSLHQGVRFMQMIATGVQRIHAEGMVHRDIKPANVLLKGDEVVVSDMEFCHLLDAMGHAPKQGSFCTVAPEVLEDGYCSISSDIYSLGATAFYLLSGSYPVDHMLHRRDQDALIRAGKLRDLADLTPHIPSTSVNLIKRALHRDPNRRPASAEKFGNDLTNSIRKIRDWQRVEPHSAHVFCLHGSAIKGGGSVDVCCLAEGTKLTLTARSTASGRRVRGISDIPTSAARLSRDIRKVVHSIG